MEALNAHKINGLELILGVSPNVSRRSDKAICYLLPCAPRRFYWVPDDVKEACDDILSNNIEHDNGKQKKNIAH